MRVILAAVILALLAGPSLAQQEQHMRGYREADPEKSPAQKAADKAAAEAYKRSLRSIPDQGPSDPWGGVRANDGSKPGAAKTATKTAKSKAKTGNTETRPQ
jgi:hypothetical protein